MNVTDDPEQAGLLLAAIETDGTMDVLIVIVILFDVAVVGEAQFAFDVNTHVNTSPFEIVDVVNVEEFVPTFTPFFFHWYDGVVPPFVGVAVNVTDSPIQTGLLLATIEIEGVTVAFTVTDVFDAALEQPLAVATTVYVPDIAVVEEAIVGFCDAEV